MLNEKEAMSQPAKATPQSSTHKHGDTCTFSNCHEIQRQAINRPDMKKPLTDIALSEVLGSHYEPEEVAYLVEAVRTYPMLKEQIENPRDGLTKIKTERDALQRERDRAVNAYQPMREAQKKMMDFLYSLTRRACLDQRNSGICVCFSCEARRLVPVMEQAIAKAEVK